MAPGGSIETWASNVVDLSGVLRVANSVLCSAGSSIRLSDIPGMIDGSASPGAMGTMQAMRMLATVRCQSFVEGGWGAGVPWASEQMATLAVALAGQLASVCSAAVRFPQQSACLCSQYTCAGRWPDQRQVGHGPGPGHGLPPRCHWTHSQAAYRQAQELKQLHVSAVDCKTARRCQGRQPPSVS